MTDPIQRWGQPREGMAMEKHPAGPYVLATDAAAHEAAAVAAARAAVHAEHFGIGELFDRGGYERGQRDAHAEFLTPAALAACGPDDPRYAKGQRDERARIRAGVEALRFIANVRHRGGLVDVVPRADVLDVIDAVPQDGGPS